MFILGPVEFNLILFGYKFLNIFLFEYLPGISNLTNLVTIYGIIFASNKFKEWVKKIGVKSAIQILNNFTKLKRESIKICDQIFLLPTSMEEKDKPTLERKSAENRFINICDSFIDRSITLIGNFPNKIQIDLSKFFDEFHVYVINTSRNIHRYRDFNNKDSEIKAVLKSHESINNLKNDLDESYVKLQNILSEYSVK